MILDDYLFCRQAHGSTIDFSPNFVFLIMFINVWNEMNQTSYRNTFLLYSIEYKWESKNHFQPCPLSPLKPCLRETRGSRTLSTPSLSNWKKIEQALSPTLLSLWLPETGTHFQPSSSPRLITFSCLRPAFNSYPALKIPASSSFHDGGANLGL